jgi:hypothetical protein
MQRWDWARLVHFSKSVERGKVQTPGQWWAIYRAIPYLPEKKRIFLYWRLSDCVDSEGLKYLFRGKIPKPDGTLGRWMR